jgi:glucan 1,3-beta-glucosidase
MRFSTVALVAAPAVVSASGMMGFSLGTKNPDSSCKTQADYEADFDAIASSSSAKLVRGYAAADCNMTKAILPAAEKKGFQVMLGIW